ncbi:MAG: phage tail tape measure protein, partial [Bacteroidetes bacterium]|nr:phage tail tape measure protein [Bacteroidota bacterium]
LIDDYDLDNLDIFESYDFVGISIMTPQRVEANKILDAIKDKWPDKIVIGGGPHVLHYLDDIKDEAWDYLVKGDGEKILPSIINGEDVEGNAKEMAKTMLDTVIGAVLLLTSAQETLGISIGEAFGPDKKKRIQFFTEVINRATEFIKRNQEGIGRFAKTLNQFIINTVSFATKVGGIFARNFGSIIEIGKQFFTVFSVAAIILVTKSLIALSISLGTKLAFNLAAAASNARLLSLGLFATATASNGATIGVSRFRAVLATLNINPIILALTALAVGLSLVGIAIRKDAKKGLEDLKQVSDDEVKSLRSLRGEFDRLKQAIKENGDVQKQNFKSGITRLEGTKKQIQAFKGLEFQLDLVSKATKNIIGFDFESTKAKKITIELLKEENLLRNEEAFNIGKANVVKNIAIQKQEELNKKLLEEQKAFENSLNFKKEGVEVDKERLRFENELEAIRTANLQRSSEGRLQLLAEERAKLLEQARKFGEDETIINREFQQRVTDEIISGIDKRVRVEQIAASKRVKIAEEQSKLDTRIEKKREKEAENDKRRRLDNLQLLSNVTGQALGLFLKSAKAQKTIALGEAIISGIVAVQRALAQPPGPPITFPLAALTGAQAAVNVAAIASQSFRKGGFPKGANTVVRVNEAGQEAILNAEATNTLGTGTIDRLNAGRGGNVTITNEISYSPTLNIGQEEGMDIIDALKRDKDNFVEFFEDLGDKGFFTNSKKRLRIIKKEN